MASDLATIAMLLGQGDKQIILLTVPANERLIAMGFETGGQFSEALVNLLHERSTDVDLEVKKKETWTSTILFEYSKTYQFKGDAVSTELKDVQ